MTALRATLVAYWLGLIAWIAALTTAALTASIAFTTLPDVAMRLPRFAALPDDEHGRLAAGLLMADVFFAADVIQLAAAPLVVAALALQLSVLGLPWRRPSNLARGALIAAAAGLLAVYAVFVAPRANGLLHRYWDAAEAGDTAGAALLREQFASVHGTAELLLAVNFALLLAAAAASAVALSPKRAGERAP